jgi:RNA polymerase sigma-70 factor, ECF subfamily
MQMTAADDLTQLLPDLLPRLWAFALRLCGNQHDAEDLLQRACLRALQRPDQLRPETTPLSWMFSITHSIWINELRARKVRSRGRVEWDDAFLDTVADPGAHTPEQNMMNLQIIETVERLPDTQRTVVLLVAVAGLSYGEAAKILGVPIGTIMSRLSRARQTIGARFSQQDCSSRKPSNGG